MFSTLENAYDVMYEQRRPTLFSAYNVSFEPHKFHPYDRCAGTFDPESQVYRRYTKDEARDCCKTVANMMNLDQSVCNQNSEYDIRYEKEDAKRTYTSEGKPVTIENYTGHLSKCSRKTLRGPKSGTFIDCPPDQIEPFTTFPYVDVDYLCNPQTPLNNASKERYTGALKGKVWVSDPWKYSQKY